MAWGPVLTVGVPRLCLHLPILGVLPAGEDGSPESAQLSEQLPSLSTSEATSELPGQIPHVEQPPAPALEGLPALKPASPVHTGVPALPMGTVTCPHLLLWDSPVGAPEAVLPQAEPLRLPQPPSLRVWPMRACLRVLLELTGCNSGGHPQPYPHGREDGPAFERALSSARAATALGVIAFSSKSLCRRFLCLQTRLSS